MFGVDVRLNAREYVDALSDLQRQQLPFAVAVALTRTAWLAKTDEQTEMGRVFNAPVPWTLDSIYVDQATKANPVAKLRFKDERTTAGFYLLPQVQGGARRHTMFEGRLINYGVMGRDQYAVPVAGADRDGAGNLNPGQIMKILSDLQTVPTARSYPGGRNAGVRASETYFATTLNGAKTGHLKPGIYRRDVGGRGIRPVFIFTRTRPNYRPIFAFDSVAQKTADREFGRQLSLALEDAVRNSNHRNKWTRR